MNLIYGGIKNKATDATKLMSIFSALPPCLCQLILAAFILLFAGCSVYNKEPDVPQQPNAPESANVFNLPGVFSINLKNIASTSTRAAWEPGFDDGEENEYKLAPASTASDGSLKYHHFMLVYGTSGTPDVFPIELPNKGDDGWTLEGTTTDNITLTVSKVFKGGEGALVAYKDERSLAQYLNGKKAYFLINVNKEDFEDTDHPAGLSSYTEEQLKAKQLSSYKISINNVEYFSMTNSTYVSGSDIICASPISAIYSDTNTSDNNIYKTEQEARTGNPVCTGYLERIASKFTVDFSKLKPQLPEEGQSYLFRYNPLSSVLLYAPDETNHGLVIDGNSYTIQKEEAGYALEVLGYAMNALEPESYLLKKLTNTSSAGYFSNWNDADKRRSYWAEDPNYVIDANTVLKYPMQFRQVLETPGIQVKHKGGEDGYFEEDDKIDVNQVNESYLEYFPFTYFMGKKGVLYTMENTYDDSEGELGDRGYYSAGTHLIVVARILINGITSNDLDLYMDQNKIFYKSDKEIIEAKLNILERVVLNQGNPGLKILETNWKEHMPENNATFTQEWNDHSFIWIKKQGESAWEKTSAEDFVLLEAELSGSDGQLFLAPADQSAKYCLAPADESGNMIEESGKDITYDHIISLIHKMIGLIDHFKEGYMYYPAIIPHNVTSLNENSYKTVGDIGVVRNNWYELTVESIDGIGRPVDNPDQPIIPNLDVKRNYLNLYVRILDWHYNREEEVW